MYRAQCLLGLFLCLALVHSWEVAISYANKISFYDSDTTRLYTLNMSFGNHNQTALTYDEVHNMLLYIDKQKENNDTICGHDISSMENKCFIKRNGSNIRAIAFDPATELLFFSDTTSRSINWISLKPGYINDDYGQHFITVNQGIPTDMAIDSCEGFLYWMKTNITTSIVERAKFDGSDRKFITEIDLLKINNSLTIEANSLTIDLQMQKLYWVGPVNNSVNRLFSSELDGRNKTSLNVLRVNYYDKSTVPNPLSSVLTVANEYVLFTNMRYDQNITAWKLGKLIFTGNVDPFKVRANNIYAGAAVKYKVKDRIRGIENNCKPLSSLDLNCDFCIHGEKVIGKPECKCKPGYIGPRCDVTVCKNYCFSGNCTFDDNGVPKCSCNPAYYGTRCDTKRCSKKTCLNNGVCSLDEKNLPVCTCTSKYRGPRCQFSKCHNLCFNGKCSFNKTGHPECSCDKAYKGKWCTIKKCNNYCLNNGDCSLDKNNNPVCKCKPTFIGNRCQRISCKEYCFQGTCYYEYTNQGYNKEIIKCRCKPGYGGPRCGRAAPFT